MHTLRFLEKSFSVMGKFAKKHLKGANYAVKMSHFLSMLPQKPSTVEMWKLAQT